MLRDVFYYGTKPNIHPREQFAENLIDARQKCTTEHFWIINEFCDYRNFDWDFEFEFLADEDVWAEEHNNVWPSQHQKDSGTWLCAKEHSDIIIYRGDVEPVKRKNERTSNWILIDAIDESKFDFSWHPDPTAPPYIYKWGCKFFPAEIQHVLEYHVEGATHEKYMHTIAELLPNNDCWTEHDLIDKTKFDMSWRPDPMDPSFIYVWGNKWVDGKLKPTLTYHTPGAVDKKYMPDFIPVLPEWDKWVEVQSVDKNKFDFTWRPDPREPAYIYTWGNKYVAAEDRPTLEYHCDGATDRKYMDEKITVLPEWERWKILQKIDMTSFDFSWRPDPKEPPFTYIFGNELYDAVKMPTIMYNMPDGPEMNYIDSVKAKLASDPSKYEHLEDAYLEDYSWMPDPDSPPYIYAWGNQWNKPEDKISVQYVVDGATEYRYMEARAIRKPSMENWDIPANIDVSLFDFSWVPNPKAPPYIYEFGTQWQKTGGPRYVVDNPIAIEYVDLQKAKRLSNNSDSNWHILDGFNIKSFDYSWHPDSTEEPYIYVFGNKWHSAEIEPTIEYRVPGATNRKYVSDIIATLADNLDNWIVPDNIDTKGFDFSWRPDPGSPPYIYEFGTQWAKTGGPKYIVPTATTTKYEDSQKVKALPNKTNFVVMNGMNIKSFDYSWHPDSTDEPYIYVFGNQWHSAEEEPTVEYRMPGAIKKKYIGDIVATLVGDIANWDIPSNLDTSSFDFSWRPNPHSPPYIYEFGTQWQKTGGPRYVVEGATTVKYEDTITAKILPDSKNFATMNNMKVSAFDYSWHPDSTEEPYIYVFGNQWFSAEKEPTIEYTTPGAIKKKYVSDTIAILAFDMTNWELPKGIDTTNFDFSWHPDPDSPAYIYQFGTQLDNTDGPRYIVPDNNGEIVYLERVNIAETSEIVVGQYYIETTLEDLVNEHPDEVFWALRKNINYDSFDFTWQPASLRDLEYVQVFGSTESELTQTYYVSAKNYLKGNKDFKFVEDLALDDTILSKIFIKPDMFFVDRGNIESAARFEALKAKFGTKIQKTRYLNSWVDTVNRCINRSTTELLWVLNSELDYSSFDFNYYPNPWQMNMVHVFGTQWSHWGTTFMINRESFTEDTKYIKIIEHLSNLNFVKSIRAKATQCVHDIVVIDHGNKELSTVLTTINSKASGRTVTTVSYTDSYFDTLRNIIKKQQEKKEHYLWICSSVCDYTDFDFSYICDPYARDQLHVFPSGMQKFGDTFFIDINKARELIAEMEKLDDFHKVNYNSTIKARRLPEPVIVTGNDTHVEAVNNVSGFPYATLITSDNEDITVHEIEPMSLWTPESKNIIVTSTGATRIVVPLEAKNYVTKELYEYPYIKRSPKLGMSNPLDIVYLSNGEVGAEENWEHLQAVTKGLKNRLVRVDGVNGRAAAYHAAAEASNTPWMFTVFAKLKVSNKFDWNWQPDRMQVPKHYIFHAKNPVNGLTYGHQAMIAYNKKLTLANEGRGLDFTLDDEHEIVPLVSGTAHYNTDSFSTWRTAFREVLKLKADDSEESRVRLEAWLTKAEGEYSEYSIKGALDAATYYKEVAGDFDKLKLSYEWAWLLKKFEETT